MKLSETIQHIYVISHPDSDRRSAILRTLDAFSCSFEFIFEHYAETINLDLEKFNVPIDFGKILLQNDFYRKNASLLLNHYTCYKKFLESDFNSVLILEDDAEIEDLTLLNTELPPTWDAITIGRGLYTDYSQPRNFILQHKTNCTESIIINRNFAKKFIDFCDTYIVDYRIDFQMNYFLDCHNNIKFFQCWPFIIQQNSILSNVSQIR